MFVCLRARQGNGKETNDSWKDGNPGVIVVKYLVKTVVCDYLDALRKVIKQC